MSTRWTPERDAALATLWSEGIPTILIAAQLGGVSRLAVIGRARRLNLPMRDKNDPRFHQHYSNPVRHREIKPKRVRAKGVKNRSVDSLPWKIKCRARLSLEPTPIQPPPIEDLFIPLDQRRSLLELTEATCKWPVGEPDAPDFFFCGAQSVDGRPYCARHLAAAYVAPTERQLRATEWHLTSATRREAA